jgi:ABC-type nitrate/sulfonate/bicarbonate transport system permease component
VTAPAVSTDLDGKLAMTAPAVADVGPLDPVGYAGEAADDDDDDDEDLLPARRRRLSGRGIRGALGVGAILVVWEVLALTVFKGHHIVPTPVSVVRILWKDRALYPHNAHTTLTEAGWGWLWGNLAALALAAVFVLAPAVEGSILRVALAIYCLPIIAIAPILEITYGGAKPKIILAALSVFFPTLIGALVGLRSVDKANTDLIRAFGGNRWHVLVKIRLRSALPSTFAGLRIAAPAAVLGAIIGEYVGGTSGLGIFMINSEQALNVPRTWGVALFAAALAGIGYALTGLVARLVTPWARPVRATR